MWIKCRYRPTLFPLDMMYNCYVRFSDGQEVRRIRVFSGSLPTILTFTRGEPGFPLKCYSVAAPLRFTFGRHAYKMPLRFIDLPIRFNSCRYACRKTADDSH